MSKQNHPLQFALNYYNIRKITGPEDEKNHRDIYVGQAPIAAIVDLSTEENVRDYLLEAEGKKRRVPTQVHKAIEATLKERPENFSVLNSGVTIVARACKVDDKNRVVYLEAPSIINGSQTKGIIKDYLQAKIEDTEFDVNDTHIKYELIVTDDEDLIAEISIARNFQNDVMTISIVGRLKQLDELEAAFQKGDPTAKLKKSETKLSEDYVKTERLLQVIWALVPEELWFPNKEFNKVYTYSMKTKCLKDFQDIYSAAKNRESSTASGDKYDHEFAKALYSFFLDIAYEAMQLYEKWKCHQGFRGTRLRKIERDGSEIVEVPDGIIFPIIASFSSFAINRDGHWKIEFPKIWNDREIIGAAASAYMNIAGSNPWNMGKHKACYSALYTITSIYKRIGQQS